MNMIFHMTCCGWILNILMARNIWLGTSWNFPLRTKCRKILLQRAVRLGFVSSFSMWIPTFQSHPPAFFDSVTKRKCSGTPNLGKVELLAFNEWSHWKSVIFSARVSFSCGKQINCLGLLKRPLINRFLLNWFAQQRNLYIHHEIKVVVLVGVLHLIAYTGRLCAKGVPFLGFRYMKGWGFG